MPIHFMGHSLGTLVNCAAADYIHGDLTGSPPNTSKNPPVQMTLFDEAELAQALHGVYVFADILLKPQGVTEPAGALWSHVIPRHFQWADNYVSLVGLLHPEAANLAACHEINFAPETAHGYAYKWYEGTITRQAAPPLSQMGHFWSFENNSLFSSALPAPGSIFKQSAPANGDLNAIIELDPSTEASFTQRGRSLIAYPNRLAYLGLAGIQSAVPAIVPDTIHYAGSVAGDVIQAFTPVNGEPVYIGTSDSTPAYFGTPPLPPPVFQANWDLHLTFGGQGGAANLNGVKPNGTISQLAPKFVALNGASSGPSVIVMPVTVPSTAVGVTFDYQFQAAGPNDFMTMGVESDNYYTMEAVDTQDGMWNTTPVIDVSSYAGQMVQLTFVLNNASGGSPVGTMQVRGIQFYSPPVPTLTLQMAAGHATVSWPLSAVGWTLELSTDLSDANSWQAVNGAPDDRDYFHTISFDIGTSSRAFFRLRK